MVVLRPRLAAVVAGVLPLCSVLGFGWDGFSWGTPAEKKHATDEIYGDNFDEYLKEHPVTAVLFYAPWCFYSQQVMPAWDLAGQKLQIHDPPVSLAKIDAHRFGSLGDKYGVRAFPTMKLFVDGAVFEYDSGLGRGWQQIVKWVNRHIDRDHVLKSVEDVDQYINDNDLNVIGLFPDDYIGTTFAKSSRHFDDISFAEARGTQVSSEIAEHLARHATLVCETVDVGQSETNSRETELPREGMNCSGLPRNPQRPDWTDQFTASVTGKTLTVKRADVDEGWQQMLQLKCCDEDTENGQKKELHSIPVPSVVMFMPHDERFARYDGDFEDSHKLDKWINARRSPMVMRLTPDTAERILNAGSEKTPVIFLIRSTSTPGGDYIEHQLTEAAKQLRGRVHICISGVELAIEKRLADLAGVDEDSMPVVTLIEAQAGEGPYHSSRKYRLNTNGLKVADVVKFIDDYEKGELKPWLRSEPRPPPEDMIGSPVVVIVGSTFKETVHDENVDVLVDFYAPWCGHCRKFEPLYKTLAKKLKHVKTLRIGKIDSTRNEVEGITIMGFPTIVLFPAGRHPKKQVIYQGSRQPDDMAQWLHDHCTHKFPEPNQDEVAPELEEGGLLEPFEEDL